MSCNRTVEDVVLSRDMNNSIIRKINGRYSGVRVLKKKQRYFRVVEVAQGGNLCLGKQIENG